MSRSSMRCAVSVSLSQTTSESVLVSEFDAVVLNGCVVVKPSEMAIGDGQRKDSRADYAACPQVEGYDIQITRPELLCKWVSDLSPPLPLSPSLAIARPLSLCQIKQSRLVIGGCPRDDSCTLNVACCSRGLEWRR